MDKIVYVEWLDSLSDDNGWVSEQYSKEWGNNEDWLIKQVGFILEETETYILLASRKNPQTISSKVSGLFKIPKFIIVKMEELK